MATFRSALRSYNAAVRRMEREDKRRAREAAIHFREQQKMQAIEDARDAVAEWEDYVDLLQTLHKSCTDPIDWYEFLNAPVPESPVLAKVNADKVQYKIDNFKPSLFDRLIFDRLFSSIEKKMRSLEQQLAVAILEDERIYAENVERHKQECEELGYLQGMAKGVLAKEAMHHKNAIEYFDPFSDISCLGSRIEMQFENELVDATIHVHGDELIPDYTLSQTSSGKLSKKKMAKGAFNELYQDHVCSAVLRVARELFNYLHVTFVRVNAVAEMLNTQTGYKEKLLILSVIIPRDTLDKMNLDAIDPSDSMGNFIHAMKFKKTDGFREIARVDWPPQHTHSDK